MKKVRGLRWWIIGMIATATVINYIDRTSLAIMWPDISKEMDITKEQYATIVSAFMIMYAIGQALSGKVFDWVGTRLGFVLSIVVWSFSCALLSVARGVASFSFFRGMLGLSEAGNWPGGVKASAEWFPVSERALAAGIFNAGASLGAVISAPLIATLYLLVGWKATLFKGSLFATRPTLNTYAAKRPDLLDIAGDLFKVVASGKVKIPVNQKYALKDAAKAHIDLESRATTGSTILLPG